MNEQSPLSGSPAMRGRTLGQFVGTVVGVVMLSLCLLTVTILGLRGEGGRVELMGEGYVNSPWVQGQPEWVAAGQTPLDYFASQSPIGVEETRQLNFWPGVDYRTVLPDVNAPSEPLDVPDWIGDGHGVYGNYDENGTFVPVVAKHGFLAHGCEKDAECQNADVCHEGQCVPTIALGEDGDDAHERAWRQASKAPVAQLAQRRARQQQLMYNMVYEHHEMMPMAFGGGLPGDDGSLPPIDAAAKAEMEAHGVQVTARQARNFDRQQLASQKQVLAEIDGETNMQLKMYDGGKLLQAKALGMQRAAKTGEKMAVKSRRGMRQAAPAAKKAGRLQRLAMGAGTGIDLTFGVGKDGEPPYHIRGAAESVRNGLVNPAAPEVLPYAQVTGSGTSGAMETVGYLSNAPGGIDGTVA
jgi:hypothetical protein